GLAGVAHADAARTGRRRGPAPGRGGVLLLRARAGGGRGRGASDVRLGPLGEAGSPRRPARRPQVPGAAGRARPGGRAVVEERRAAGEATPAPAGTAPGLRALPRTLRPLDGSRRAGEPRVAVAGGRGAVCADARGPPRGRRSGRPEAEGP